MTSSISRYLVCSPSLKMKLKSGHSDKISKTIVKISCCSTATKTLSQLCVEKLVLKPFLELPVVLIQLIAPSSAASVRENHRKLSISETHAQINCLS